MEEDDPDRPWIPYAHLFDSVGFATNVFGLPRLVWRLAWLGDTELLAREARARELARQGQCCGVVLLERHLEPLRAALRKAGQPVARKSVGEQLYPLVHKKQPDKAGKITGMLLELTDAELFALLMPQDTAAGAAARSR